MIEAKVIADSISPDGVRLTTIEVQFWRPMLAEFNTHRQFSRNSASSRAIPLTKANGTGTLDRVKNDPAWPEYWPAEQTGMSGGAELEGADLHYAKELFAMVRYGTIQLIEAYIERQARDFPDDPKAHTLHKSVLNRLLEPFMWHRVIVTSTEWENFFAQRCHKDAQPEIRLAAEAMRDALNASTPTPLKYGEFHLPYTYESDKVTYNLKDLIAASVARCARVSYLTHDGTRDFHKDLDLFLKLDGQNPPHLSPMEHVATPAKPKKWYTPWRKNPLGNFNGWTQVRHKRELAR